MHIAAFAPARINLFLAVTGKRSDGFHNLISLVAPLRFGDRLWLEVGGAVSSDELICDRIDQMDRGPDNLVWKAVRAFRSRTGYDPKIRIRLEKAIPVGAGLGGGSSDAAAMLRALNTIAPVALSSSDLRAIGAEIGSDVPLFLSPGPVVIRDRGDTTETVGESGRNRVSGKAVLVFLPEFRINTGWAYRSLADSPEFYSVPEPSNARVRAWLESEGPIEDLLFNSFEQVLARKFLAIAVLLAKLRETFGIACGVSGSGSACFALLEREGQREIVTDVVRRSWGEDAFMVESAFV